MSNIWGNSGNRAYGVPMEFPLPRNPNLPGQYLAWDTVKQLLVYAPGTGTGGGGTPPVDPAYGAFNVAVPYPPSTIGAAIKTALANTGGGGGGASTTDTVTHTQFGSSGITRTLASLIQDEAVSAKNFGAVGDGIADDTFALQAAINYGVLKKVTIYLPPGTYKITSGLVIDSNIPTDPSNVGAFAPRTSLIGGGSRNTRIKVAGSFNAISIGAGTHFEPMLQLAGIYLEGTGKTGIGLNLSMLVLFQIDDVVCTGFNTGIYALNCLGGELHRVLADRNKYGVKLQSGVFAGPNAYNFNFCKLAENDNLGLQAIDAVTLLITGGAVEANGVGGTDMIRGGVYCIPGRDGVAGLTCVGVYFEANQGQADVYLDEINASNSTNSFTGCTFNRLSNTSFATNNIVGYAAAGRTLAISVTGCGFQGYNDYIASSSRPYFKIIGGDVRFSWSGCYMAATVEYPAMRNFIGGVRVGGNDIPLIQGGGDANPSYTTITFPIPYSRPPGVFIMPIAFVVGDGVFHTAEVVDVPTTTSFKIRKTQINRATGAFSDSNQIVQWIAFGNGLPNE